MEQRWKYVVYRDGGDAEAITVFDLRILHADQMARLGVARDRVVSAGFVSPARECFGHSTSLGVASRPSLDTALLRSSS